MKRIPGYLSSRLYDSGLADELARWEAEQIDTGFVVPADAPNAFQGYSRELSERGGLLITYREKASGLFLDVMRVLTLPTAVGLLAWLLFWQSPLPLSVNSGFFVFGSIAIAFVVLHPIPISHSIEIHPDGMTVDGRHFSIEQIGDENWPELQMKDGDPLHYVLVGIYGTRFLEYSSLARWDEADRTVERLAQDLQLAMEQLWRRRDDMIPEAQPYG